MFKDPDMQAAALHLFFTQIMFHHVSPITSLASDVRCMSSAHMVAVRSRVRHPLLTSSLKLAETTASVLYDSSSWDVHRLSYLFFADETTLTFWTKSRTFQVKSQNIILKSGEIISEIISKLIETSKLPMVFPFFSSKILQSLRNPMGSRDAAARGASRRVAGGLLRGHRGERGGRLDLVRLLGRRWGSPGELRGPSDFKTTGV